MNESRSHSQDGYGPFRRCEWHGKAAAVLHYTEASLQLLFEVVWHGLCEDLPRRISLLRDTTRACALAEAPLHELLSPLFQGKLGVNIGDEELFPRLDVPACNDSDTGQGSALIEMTDGQVG